ncbi:hypothetical protein C8R44DRAFT_892098 [Mycena epipterygia]|nr:hypothetical protein C8R44DRAFT_892098 [Mycena epipterygia]
MVNTDARLQFLRSIQTRRVHRSNHRLAHVAGPEVDPSQGLLDARGKSSDVFLLLLHADFSASASPAYMLPPATSRPARAIWRGERPLQRAESELRDGVSEWTILQARVRSPCTFISEMSAPRTTGANGWLSSLPLAGDPHCPSLPCYAPPPSIFHSPALALPFVDTTLCPFCINPAPPPTPTPMPTPRGARCPANAKIQLVPLLA